MRGEVWTGLLGTRWGARTISLLDVVVLLVVHHSEAHPVTQFHLPGPSNRSPLATFKSTKASRGDLLEGAGTCPGCSVSIDEDSLVGS